MKEAAAVVAWGLILVGILAFSIYIAFLSNAHAAA